MLDALVAYIGGFDIGEYVDSRRLLTPVQAFPNHEVSMLAAGRSGGGQPVTDSTNINLTDLLTLAASDVTISIS